jgi:hypothetical protein
MGAFTLNAEGITREEIRYQKFVRRLRTALSELLVKPWYLQMCLDYPDLAEDHKFTNAIGIQYHNDNLFEEMKEKDVDAKRIAAFTAKKGILNEDGTPFFHTNYLIRKELKMNDADLEANQQWFDQDTTAAERVEGAVSAMPSAGGVAPAATASAPAAVGGETVEGGEVAGTGQL